MFISDDKRLIDIQGEFNAKFPNLKIVFYSKQCKIQFSIYFIFQHVQK